MTDIGVIAYSSFFEFDKITNLGAFADTIAFTQMGKGTDFGAGGND